MSATIRATTSAATAIQITSVLITKPAGTADDDLLLAFLGIRQIPGVVTAPTGWKEIASIDVPPTPTVGEFMRVYRRIAKSEPADYTWTWTGAQQAAITMVALDVHDGQDVILGVATANGTSHKTPDIATTEASMLLLASYTLNKQSSFTPPSGFVENEDVQSGSSNGITAMLCNKVQTDRGDTGEFDATSADAETGVAFIVSIRDPAVTERVNLETGLKTNVLNATDVIAGVEVISAEADRRNSLTSVFISTVGAGNIRVEDSSGRVLVPEITFGSDGGTFGPFAYDVGKYVGRIGKSLKIKSSTTALASIQIEAQPID